MVNAILKAFFSKLQSALSTPHEHHQTLALLFAAVVGTGVSASEVLPAFPGAEGFGALAAGGRGGQVLKVTNLGDNLAAPPAGSLRATIKKHNTSACGNSGGCPSTVVFEVGGIIDLEAPIVVTAPYLTLAGQTAPGGGITLRAKQDDTTIDGYLLKLLAHDIVVRHLRIRPGAGSNPQGTELGGVSVVTENAYNIILDHLSVSWAEDKALTIFEGPHDITVQNSILAETLGCANHRKSVANAPPETQCSGVYCCEALMDQGRNGTPHSRLVTISSNPLDPAGGEGPVSPENISFRGNLLANTNKRFPNITARTYVNFVNNTIYNFGAAGAIIHAGKDPTQHHVDLNYVQNYVRTGPWTVIYEQLAESPGSAIEILPPGGNAYQAYKHQIYEQFNILDQLAGESVLKQGSPEFVDWLEYPIPDTAVEPVPLSTVSASSAFDWTQRFAGAFPRDSVDERVVTEVACRWGGIVDDPVAEIGGWPVPTPGTPQADIDGDGMPDVWEETQVPPLVVGDPFDGNDDADGDGFTNLEEYLAERSAAVVAEGDTAGTCTDVDPPSQPVISQLTVLDSTSISVRWHASKDRVLMDHYELQIREQGGHWVAAQQNLVITEGTIEGLLSAATVDVRVVAYDSSGNASASEPGSATTPLAVQTPHR